MRLRTIWSGALAGATVAERVDRTKDWLAIEVAARLPRRVRYWSFVLTGASLFEGDEVVPDARYMDLLARMDKP
jgi:hypothetical protein